ncbi:MAG TPA: hypothetical protein VEJ36_09030 [Nitrososphaerales archaeon]|nr:hypothetical protein [Nitrososphaerales archaeon]
MTSTIGQTIERNLIRWLLDESQPGIRYHTLLDIEQKRENDSEVKEAKSALTSMGWAAAILKEQKPNGMWQSRPKGSLYGPKYVATNWRAIVLSDLGLDREDARIRKTAELFFREWMPPGVDWSKEGELCVVGNLARFMTRFGYSSDERVKELFDWLVQSQKEDGGWHCFESDSGTLDCWEGLAAFAALPRRRWTRGVKRAAERGAEFYLARGLLREGKKYAPWYRFHYPNHYYYDVLVGLDTLSALGYIDDPRAKPALEMMMRKRRSDGSWALDATHPDIGHGANYSLRKRATPFVLEEPGVPSKWATMVCLRVLRRLDGRQTS